MFHIFQLQHDFICLNSSDKILIKDYFIFLNTKILALFFVITLLLEIKKKYSYLQQYKEAFLIKLLVNLNFIN